MMKLLMSIPRARMSIRIMEVHIHPRTVMLTCTSRVTSSLGWFRNFVDLGPGCGSLTLSLAKVGSRMAIAKANTNCGHDDLLPKHETIMLSSCFG